MCRRPALSLLFTAVLVLPVAACSEDSRVDPDATVVVSGQALAAAGTPLADRPVRLVSISDADDAALGIFTLGLGCTGDACDDDIRTAKTDATGNFALELEGRDTQTSFGNVRPQALSLTAAPMRTEVSGASVSARFVIQNERVRLPPLRLVDPALSLASAPGRVGTTWRTEAAGPFELTFETNDVVPVWQVTTGGSSATVDGRVLEGTAGRTVLSGGLTDEIEGSEVDIRWRSPGLGYAAASSSPVSRNLPCTYGAGASAVMQEQCSLTDGDLFQTGRPPAANCPTAPSGATAPPCPSATTVSIVLPASAKADLVVIRGCATACTVEASSDGRTYLPAGRVTGDFGAVRLPDASTRAVRVGRGGDGLREISVWEPNSDAPGLRPIAADDVDELRRPYDAAAADRGVPAVVIALAGVLCLAGALGVGFLLGRRRAS